MARADPLVYTLCSNAGAGNGADVAIKGGLYTISAEATWSAGNAQLQGKSPNGTYINIGSSITANAFQSSPMYLPAGTYRVVITTATAAFVYLMGIG